MRQILHFSALVLVLLTSTSVFAATLRVDASAHHRGLEPVDITLVVPGERAVDALDGSGEGSGDAGPTTQPFEFEASLVGAGVAVFEGISPGAVELMISAEGFDVWSRSLTIAGDQTVAASIFPAADVLLSGSVIDRHAAPVSGATISVDGPRIAVARVVESAEDGTFAVEALPAGYYDIIVTAPSARNVRRGNVDVLGPTELGLVLPDANEPAEVTESRRPICSSAQRMPSGLLALVALGLVLPRRRR